MTPAPDFADIASRAAARGIMVTAAGVEEIAGMLALSLPARGDRARVERDPTDRENWLIDCLHYSIQFHIWADATREQVGEVIERINEMSCWDDHAAALVQVPRGVSHQETQEAVDRVFGSPSRPSTSSEGDSSVDAAAKALYIRETANDPVIHCNRFPAWEELSDASRNEYRARARGSAQ